jgi:hypothetical protein
MKEFFFTRPDYCPDVMVTMDASIVRAASLYRQVVERMAAT